MFNWQRNDFYLTPKRNSPTRKIFLTLFLLFLFRFGTTIPLTQIDQEALRRSLFQLENKNALLQILNLFVGSEKTTLLNPFSLGIIPYINASILIDLLTTSFPFFEKIKEEGEAGKKKILFYKKIGTFVFSIFQSVFILFYLKPYFYLTTPFSYGLFVSQLVSGSMVVVWLTNLIDKRGIGNGTSLIIFSNIISSLLNKKVFESLQWTPLSILEGLVLLGFVYLICLSQSAKINIEVVSARQLTFLKTNESSQNLGEIETRGVSLEEKEIGLLLRLNQAGIFPLIIASNLLPFLLSMTNNLLETIPFLKNGIYYVLIITFNYFYTIIFWDPEKISEQLRKASVSLVNIRPGKETLIYLEKLVFRTSILGGIFLCGLLICYDFLQGLLQGPLLAQINISSLIIFVGISYEIQKTIRALYKKK